jgi:hypothetical protein
MAKRGRPKNKEQVVGATQETAAKLRADTLQFLYNRQLITADHERAGREITDIARAMGRAFLRTQRLGSGGVGGEPADAMTPREAFIYSKRFKPWVTQARKWLVAQWPTKFTQYDLVLKICDENAAVQEVGAYYDMNDKRVVRALIRGLNRYMDLVAKNPLDEAALAA